MRLYTLSQVFNKNIYIVLSVDTLKMRLYTLSHIMNQNALLWLWGSMNYVHLWLRRIPFFFPATSMHHLVDSVLVAPYSSEVVHHSDEAQVLKSLLQGDLLLIPYPSNQSILCWSMLVSPFITFFFFSFSARKGTVLRLLFWLSRGLSTEISLILCAWRMCSRIFNRLKLTVTWVKLQYFQDPVKCQHRS